MPRSPTARTVAVLWLATWCAFLCVGVPLAVLPTYVADALHGSDVMAGFAVGSLSLAAMVARPIGGRMADERSRRLVVGGGLAACVLGGALLWVSRDYATLVAARMIAGVGESCVYAAAMAWALDLTPRARHGSAIALFGMAIWLGATVGTAFGEVLHSGTGSYRAVWASVVVIPAAGLLALGLAAREAPRPRRIAGVRSPLVRREAVRPGAGLALANLGYGAVASLVTLHLSARGVGSPALTLTAVAGAVVLTRLVVAAALDRTGPYRVLVAGCLAQTVGLVVIAAAGSLPVALAGGALLGAGYAAVFPSLALMVVRAVPDDARGSALGSFTAFLDLGLAVGGPLAGLIATLLGRPQAFLIAGGLALLALAVVPRAPRGPDGPDESTPHVAKTSNIPT